MQIYFVNADDKNKRAIAEKQKLLRSHGIEQLAPGWYGFRPTMLTAMLRSAIADESASSTIVILDTAKKFMDLLDRKSVNTFNTELEGFTAAGGTVVATGHVNKHKNENDEYVYKGTSDVVDDWHCAWLGTPIKGEGATRFINFSNLKARGDVPNAVTFSFEESRDDYQLMFESVTRVPKNQEERLNQEAKFRRETEHHADVIEAIKAEIAAGNDSKTVILRNVAKSGTEPERVVLSILDQFTGIASDGGALWKVTRGRHNKHIYTVL